MVDILLFSSRPNKLSSNRLQIFKKFVFIQVSGLIIYGIYVYLLYMVILATSSPGWLFWVQDYFSNENLRLSQNKHIHEVRFSQKKRNRRHAMISNDSSSKCAHVSSSACAYERCSLPERPPFWLFSGGWMPLISALARNMATALQRLRQNHRGQQEVGLLYSLYSVTSCTQLSVWSVPCPCAWQNLRNVDESAKMAQQTAFAHNMACSVRGL
jgi:hypothetical protein